MKMMLGAESLERCPVVLGFEIGIGWGAGGSLQDIPGESPRLDQGWGAACAPSSRELPFVCKGSGRNLPS